MELHLFSYLLKCSCVNSFCYAESSDYMLSCTLDFHFSITFCPEYTLTKTVPLVSHLTAVYNILT